MQGYSKNLTQEVLCQVTSYPFPDLSSQQPGWAQFCPHVVDDRLSTLSNVTRMRRCYAEFEPRVVGLLLLLFVCLNSFHYFTAPLPTKEAEPHNNG